MNNTIKRTWNQGSMVNIEDLRGMAFQAESGGHTFVISAVDADGNAVSLSGTPAGTMLRPDNTDQALTCSISGGKVYATLPAGCYDVPGRAGITIFLTSGGQKAAIYAAVVSVTRTQSGTASPGTTASVVDLVNAINTAIAGIPATDTALKAAMAPTYSNSALYAVGDYAWYNGTLYRCTTAITTAETWTSGHWTAAAIGADSANGLRELKSALKAKENNGHSGVKYTGVKFASSNTAVSGSVGSVAVYRIQPNDSVKVVIKASSAAGIYVNRDGIGLSNNPIPTIGETISRIGTTHAITQDTTIEFDNADGYKYCYVYYSTEDVSGDPNTYITFTTVNALYGKVDKLEDDVDSLELAVTANGGIKYTGLAIQGSYDYVSEVSEGTLAVYKIIPKDIIKVKISVDQGNYVNRDGIGLSNDPVPVKNAEVSRVWFTHEISSDQEIEFFNKDGYSYLYVYYSTYSDEAPDPNSAIVIEMESKNELYGYEKIDYTSWNQGSRTDSTLTTRIITGLIPCDPIGREWAVVVPNGYGINVYEYDYNGNYVGAKYSSLQTGTVAFSVSTTNFKIMLGIMSGVIYPFTGETLGIYKKRIEQQYSSLKFTGKIVSLMGDSITTFGGSVSDPTQGRFSPEGNPYTYPGNKCRYPQTDLEVTEPQQTYWLKAIMNLGMVLGINDSIAGSRVSGSGVPSDPQDGHYGSDWYMALQKRIDRLAIHVEGEENPVAPNIIIINGGTNDANNEVPVGTPAYLDPSDISDYSQLPTDNFANAYRTMLLRMMHTYKEAKIICLLPNYGSLYTGEDIDQYDEVIKELCDMYGIKWIDMRTSGITPFNQTTFMVDSLHPNYKGMQLIGDRLTKALLFEV